MNTDELRFEKGLPPWLILSVLICVHQWLQFPVGRFLEEVFEASQFVERRIGDDSKHSRWTTVGNQGCRHRVGNDHCARRQSFLPAGFTRVSKAHRVGIDSR